MNALPDSTRNTLAVRALQVARAAGLAAIILLCWAVSFLVPNLEDDEEQTP